MIKNNMVDNKGNIINETDKILAKYRNIKNL